MQFRVTQRNAVQKLVVEMMMLLMVQRVTRAQIVRTGLIQF